ncbi:MAG: KamA family radical SAM protein, partial [Proteobacteria bacterium]|nr:KamA family radical SAM protein [Pseudomonadota bacterium]
SDYMSGLELDEIKAIAEKYPFFANRYYRELVSKHPELRGIIIPDKRESEDTTGLEDPLGEERDSPVPGIVHKYPDRVLFLVHNIYPIHCRYCTRKRILEKKVNFGRNTWDKGIEYIKNHREIFDVLISGCDPLLSNNNELRYLIENLKSIDYVGLIRIGTRVPSAFPVRIDNDLITLLSDFTPLHMNIHFVHPAEITREVADACLSLSRARIILGARIVLLKGINDDPETLKILLKKLMEIGVKPYALFHPDNTRGTSHFRLDIEKGISLVHSLRSYISGMAIPHYMINLYPGGGKVEICYNYIKLHNRNTYNIENYKGELFEYR